MEMVVTTGLLELWVVCNAPVKSSPPTNQHPVFYRPDGMMPFLSPNQQCQSTEGKISHAMDFLTPSSPGGLPTLSLTTNSSWLPWGDGCHASHQPSDAGQYNSWIKMKLKNCKWTDLMKEIIQLQKQRVVGTSLCCLPLCQTPAYTARSQYGI